jgi:HD-GYP domain-containing protein (c-di-GMP phosphodiesterase class II)
MDEVFSILKDGAAKQWDAQIVKVFIDTVQKHGDPHAHEEHEHGPDFQKRESGLIVPSEHSRN